jgi:hypothetical protein
VYQQESTATTQNLGPWNLIGRCMTASPTVIAQQYSSTTYVSPGFHSRKVKNGAFKKRCFFPSFSLLKLLKTESL